MTEGTLLPQLLDRLRQEGLGEALFGADEVTDWPAGAFHALTKAGLLTRASPAQSITCPGCEQDCLMSIHVLPGEGARPAHAFISCDKRSDIGRVSVEISRLAQWKVTEGLLARALARILSFTASPQKEDTANVWAVGMLNGSAHRGLLKLAIGDSVSLQIAGHEIPLAEVLTLDGGNLTLDTDELLRLVDQPAMPAGDCGYTPSTARREARKLDTQEMYEGWRKAYRDLRKHKPGMSDMWYSRQIEKMPIANRRDSETIRKHMKK